MNSRSWLMAGAVSGLMIGTTFAAEKTGEAAPAPATTNAVAVKAQTACPVMGGPVDKSRYVDYDGKRIYVCCGACVAKIKKNPAKYVKQLEDQGITLDKVPAPKEAK